MRLVAYARVSSEEQANDGVSLAAQESRLRAWCLAMGHDLVAVESDAGVSGATPPSKRHGFQRAHAALGETADGIVFVAIDRLSRSVRDILGMVDEFRVNEWALVSLRESLDTSSATGRMIVTILATLAEFERDVIGERTAAALSELRATNKPFTRFAPWGYRREGDTLIDDPHERGIAERVAEASSQTAACIAEWLQEHAGNHPRSGRPWTPKDVDRVRRSIARAKKAEARK